MIRLLGYPEALPGMQTLTRTVGLQSKTGVPQYRYIVFLSLTLAEADGYWRVDYAPSRMDRALIFSDSIHESVCLAPPNPESFLAACMTLWNTERGQKAPCSSGDFRIWRPAHVSIWSGARTNEGVLFQRRETCSDLHRPDTGAFLILEVIFDLANEDRPRAWFKTTEKPAVYLHRLRDRLNRLVHLTWEDRTQEAMETNRLATDQDLARTILDLQQSGKLELAKPLEQHLRYLLPRV